LEFADPTREDYASCANFNGPMQTVIAGTDLGIFKASEKLKAMGAKRIIDLPVSAPFHCALMKPVQEKMRELLAPIIFLDTKVPIISNVTAEPEIKGERIRRLLIEQIVSPVKFTECVSYAIAHDLRGDGFLELGPKNTLSTIVKKIDKDLPAWNMDSPNDIKELPIIRN
jgi:[acyl-carrier-protein] S-malonyltransferase